MGIRTLLCATFSAGVMGCGVAAADEAAAPVISLGGFLRADYGNGDRYPEARGEDRLGVSKAALALNATYEDIKGVFVVGTERLTDGNPDNDGNVDVKDAYIVIGDGKKTGFKFSVGAQPLLFGLKPNGYPGDSSLQPSIEYGGGGGFAVSQQAGPSLIGTYMFTPTMSLRFGAFDLDSDNRTGITPPTHGSKLSDNLFVLWRAEDLVVPGLYASAGAESIYVGGAVNDNHRIFSVGVGYKQPLFDVSVEYIGLDREIVATAGDEHYVVAEATVYPAPKWTAYLDYSRGQEIDVDTYRLGASYQWYKYVAVSLEYSKDKFGAPGVSSVSSVDARLTFSY